MFHLLQIEWLKLRPYGVFRVLVVLYMILLPSLILITKSIPEFPPPINTSDTFFKFPTVFTYLGYSGNWLAFFFLGFLGVILVTQEFSNRTLRQNIITGLSRTEFFLSKFYTIILICLLAAAYYGLVAFAYGITHTPTLYSSVILQNIDYIPRFFLMCLGYMSFAFFLGVLIRRTGIAIFLYLCYVMFIELILRWGVHVKIIANKSMHFYPMNATEDLIPIPFSDAADGFSQQFEFPFFLSPLEAAITTLIYSGLFFFLSHRMLMRKDL